MKRRVIADEFVCPISQTIMRDPVVAADGISYERESISQWLLSKNTSPMTGAKLPSNVLFPNYNLKSLIQKEVPNESDKTDKQNIIETKTYFDTIKSKSEASTIGLSGFHMSWYQPTSVTGNQPPMSYYGSMVAMHGSLWLRVGINTEMHMIDSIYKFKPDDSRWHLMDSNTKESDSLLIESTMSVAGFRLICYGGYDILSQKENHHIFIADINTTLEPVTWKKLTVKNPDMTPPGRINHTATVIGDKLFIFGGGKYKNFEVSEDSDNELEGNKNNVDKNETSETFSDLCCFDLTTLQWQTIVAQGPSARVFHCSCGIEWKDKKLLYIFGGAPQLKTTNSEDAVFGDLWAFDVNTNIWRQIHPSPPSPPSPNDLPVPCPRGSTSLVQLPKPHDHLLLLFGGYDGVRVLSDIWIFDMIKEQWCCVAEDQVTGAVPTPRGGYAVARLGNRIYYFGGFSINEGSLDDLQVLQIDFA